MSDVLKTERMKSELETYADDGKKLSLSELKALKSEFEERGYAMRFNSPPGVDFQDREICIFYDPPFVYYKVNKVLKDFPAERKIKTIEFQRINLND